MADFVKLSIFGTVRINPFGYCFSKLRFWYANTPLIARVILYQVFEVTTRYVDLQPVGMGAFGLVWSVPNLEYPIVSHFLTCRFTPRIHPFSTRSLILDAILPTTSHFPVQFCEGPALWDICCDQEDHEALFYPRAEQEDVSRAQTAQASQA